MDVLDELISDHRNMRDLIHELRSGVVLTKRKKAILEELIPFFELHTQAQEKTVDAYARKIRELKFTVTTDYEEHAFANYLLFKIRRTKKEENWNARVHLFCKMLEHHLDEEEEVFFRELRPFLTEEESHSLAVSYRELTKGLDETRERNKPGLLSWLSPRAYASPSDSIVLRS